MKLLMILLTATALQVSAAGSAQTITLKGKNISLEKVFRAVKKQTGYSVVCSAELLQTSSPVDVNASDAPLETFLQQVLKGQPLEYSIENTTIFIARKTSPDALSKISTGAVSSDRQPESNLMEISGRVTNGNGNPLAGASVKVKGSTLGTTTNNDGAFTLKGMLDNVTLIISYVGYETIGIKLISPTTAVVVSSDRQKSPGAEDNADTEISGLRVGQSISFGPNTQLLIKLNPKISSLDQVQIIAYGTTSRRLSTGNVTTVKKEEIEKQVITNPLQALAGRVPGMMVTQSSGNPRSTFDVLIRGKNSISQGSNPLYIIDGLPYSNSSLGQVGSYVNQGSPMSNINPLDIESIVVLKDADATAIYGSRGANGVVLITTKSGRAGTTKVDASVYTGIGEVKNRLKLLNTEQYRAMRKEAFANDNIAYTLSTAPDLVAWDSTRYTDWQDYLIGKQSNITNANLSLSGGSQFTQFAASLGYNRQGIVYPGNYAYSRGTARINVSHSSTDRKFQLKLSTSASTDRNELPGSDLTYSVVLPPNAPLPFDENNNLAWEENGGLFTNPLTYLKRKTHSVMDNFLFNAGISYELVKGLSVKASGGYSLIQFNRTNTNPLAAQDPNSPNSIASSNFDNTTSRNYILEPQIEYVRDISKGKLSVMVGTTIQNEITDESSIEAEGFSNDVLVDAAEFAQTVTSATARTEYRYQALFGRIHYAYDNRYVVNLTGRRDGSSRFGPDKRIANFGAVGAAWVFTEDLKPSGFFDWLYFGKIRTSYGITGNDQIGDYQYLDNYEAVRYPYQGSLGYIPSRLFNSDYTWERNRKFEVGLELGLLENNLQFTADWFLNRSDNQLVNYKLADQTGFPSNLRNFGALVQNMGWEWSIAGTLVKKTGLTWDITANLTINRNKLLKFPGIEASSYANTLVVGEPVTIQKYLHWTGVDPNTGLYTFTGVSRPTNQTQVADYTPQYFGGIGNNLRYGNWELNVLFQFIRQKGVDYIERFAGYPPGYLLNQLTDVLGRWRKPGDETAIQRFTTAGAGATAFSNYATYSDARITDASFIRLKNVYFSYTIPAGVLSRFKVKNAKLFYQGQNLLTITSYKGYDPEINKSPFVLPPLVIHSFGLQINL